MSINKATTTVSDIVDKVAKITLKKKVKKKAFESKKWYDFELSKRKILLCEKATLMSNYPGDPYIRGFFYKCNKEYAKMRRYKKKEYTQNILDRLDKLQANDSKQYWQLVNSLREGTKNDNFANSIDGNTWFDYFSNLSTVAEQYAKRIEEIEIKIKDMIKEMKYTSFSSIDFKITAPQLQKAFSKLKPNKSAGLDSIYNEMLKAAQVYLTPLLLMLYIYNIRALSVNIQFICTSFRNRQNSEPSSSFSGLFRSEYK